MHASDTAEFALAAIADFELTDAQFHRIRALVREHTGIALSDAKRQLVYGRLSRRLRALKLGSFREYIELLERGVANELEEFTNAITTNLTSFFREPHHFEYLATDLLPQSLPAIPVCAARVCAARPRRAKNPIPLAWCCQAAPLLHGFDIKVFIPIWTPGAGDRRQWNFNAERLTSVASSAPPASSERAAVRTPASFACRTSCET
jgi:hypothetical protein